MHHRYKSTLLMASALAAALLLSACGGGAEPAVTVTVTETAEAPSSELVETQEEEPAEEAPKPEPTAEEKEAADEIEFKSHGESPRGKIIKHVGDWAGLSDSSGETTVAFRITEIESKPKCDSGYSTGPQNDQLVRLQFEVITYPELKDHGDFWMTAHDFTAFKEDGSRVNDAIGAGIHCLSDATALPELIGPGEKVSGGIVLDLPTNTKVISFSPAGDSMGWEWPLDQNDGA